MLPATAVLTTKIFKYIRELFSYFTDFL